MEPCRDMLRKAKIICVVEWRVILSHISLAACKGTMSISILVTRRSLTVISDHLAKRYSLAYVHIPKVAAPKRRWLQPSHVPTCKQPWKKSYKVLSPGHMHNDTGPCILPGLSGMKIWAAGHRCWGTDMLWPLHLLPLMPAQVPHSRGIVNTF